MDIDLHTKHLHQEDYFYVAYSEVPTKHCDTVNEIFLEYTIGKKSTSTAHDENISVLLKNAEAKIASIKRPILTMWKTEELI